MLNTQLPDRWFDVESALRTIHSLNFIRVCGSAGESCATDVLTCHLNEIGVGWHYHTFRDNWLETHDPHLLIKGRKITVRPALELSFHHGIDYVNNERFSAGVCTDLASVDNCAGKIVVAYQFDQDRPMPTDAVAQLMAFQYEPEMEAYLWAQVYRDRLDLPIAIIAPEDIPLVIDSIGEQAELKWSVMTIEREFRNLVAEIPGTRMPDEMVVMGAHTDSWPGTVGASDDAAGCAVLIEAARWFAAHPPERTVRLVWFTGEEVDARGSRRYVSECIDDPGKVRMMINVDSGCELNTGPFNSYTSDESTIEWARMNRDLVDMENIITKASGLDAGAFIARGIPAFGVEAPFRHDYHSPEDCPANIDLRKLEVLGSLSTQTAIQAACE